MLTQLKKFKLLNQLIFATNVYQRAVTPIYISCYQRNYFENIANKTEILIGLPCRSRFTNVVLPMYIMMIKLTISSYTSVRNLKIVSKVNLKGANFCASCVKYCSNSGILGDIWCLHFYERHEKKLFEKLGSLGTREGWTKRQFKSLSIDWWLKPVVETFTCWN